jgi:hypothetical protein
MTYRQRFLCLGIALLSAGFWSASVGAQELTPRAYWPAPNGLKAIVFSYQYTTGDVLTDASLPITGVDSKLNLAQLAYLHTFSLVGRTANVQFALPYSWGTTEGLAEGAFSSRYISGTADVRARLSVNLLGAPTMDAAEFQQLRASPRSLIGASLMIQFPTGAYDEDKVFNAGTNRWAIKPAVGFIVPIRSTWLLEAEIGAWFFGDNDEFLGVTREQAPVLTVELHLVKRIRPGFWAAFDVNYYGGGQSTVDGILSEDLQRNSRIGGTVMFPFKLQHAIKASFSTGTVTKSGGNFSALGVSYLYAWS